MLKKIIGLLKKRNLPKKTDDKKQIEKKQNTVKSKSVPQEKKTDNKKSHPNREKIEQTKPRPKAKPKWSAKDFPVPQVEGEKRFYDFPLPNSLQHAIADLGFKYCTPIQAQILEHTLKGRDAIGKAQTGTGKTAAFLITSIVKIIRRSKEKKRIKGAPHTLIMAPTRELVLQIERDAIGLSKYNNLNIVAVYGGVDYTKQLNKIKGKYIDIMIATPGRLVDYMQKKIVHLEHVEIFVLDEADRMLDMGFMPDIRKIERKTPRKEERQTLFFSATFPDNIRYIADNWTVDPVIVEIDQEHKEAKEINQITYIVSDDEKFKLLYNMLKKNEFSKVIVFCNRKDISRKVYDKLKRYGFSTTLLTGDIDQKRRTNRLENFKTGKVKILVATDVAGRGIHIESISHVINFNLPDDPEDYVHRIGRTGRAGELGTSVSFASEGDSFQIPAIEKYLEHKLELSYPEDDLFEEIPPLPKREKSEQSNHNRGKKRYSGQKKNYSGQRNKRDGKPRK
jgi:ATP-dependent RNA helicase RhlB